MIRVRRLWESGKLMFAFHRASCNDCIYITNSNQNKTNAFISNSLSDLGIHHASELVHAYKLTMATVLCKKNSYFGVR